jgi:hypothetical protein
VQRPKFLGSRAIESGRLGALMASFIILSIFAFPHWGLVAIVAALVPAAVSFKTKPLLPKDVAEALVMGGSPITAFALTVRVWFEPVLMSQVMSKWLYSTVGIASPIDWGVQSLSGSKAVQTFQYRKEVPAGSSPCQVTGTRIQSFKSQ